MGLVSWIFSLNPKSITTSHVYNYVALIAREKEERSMAVVARSISGKESKRTAR